MKSMRNNYSRFLVALSFLLSTIIVNGQEYTNNSGTITFYPEVCYPELFTLYLEDPELGRPLVRKSAAVDSLYILDLRPKWWDSETRKYYSSSSFTQFDGCGKDYNIEIPVSCFESSIELSGLGPEELLRKNICVLYTDKKSRTVIEPDIPQYFLKYSLTGFKLMNGNRCFFADSSFSQTVQVYFYKIGLLDELLGKQFIYYQKNWVWLMIYQNGDGYNMKGGLFNSPVHYVREISETEEIRIIQKLLTAPNKLFYRYSERTDSDEPIVHAFFRASYTHPLFQEDYYSYASMRERHKSPIKSHRLKGLTVKQQDYLDRQLEKVGNPRAGGLFEYDTPNYIVDYRSGYFEIMEQKWNNYNAVNN